MYIWRLQTTDSFLQKFVKQCGPRKMQRRVILISSSLISSKTSIWPMSWSVFFYNAILSDCWLFSLSRLLLANASSKSFISCIYFIYFFLIFVSSSLTCLASLVPSILLWHSSFLDVLNHAGNCGKGEQDDWKAAIFTKESTSSFSYYYFLHHSWRMDRFEVF